MTVEISSEAYRVLERSVQEGHYDSLQQALDGSVFQANAINQQAFDSEFVAYAREKIEAGLADMAAGRVLPAEEVFAKLHKRAAR